MMWLVHRKEQDEAEGAASKRSRSMSKNDARSLSLSLSPILDFSECTNLSNEHGMEECTGRARVNVARRLAFECIPGLEHVAFGEHLVLQDTEEPAPSTSPPSHLALVIIIITTTGTTTGSRPLPLSRTTMLTSSYGARKYSLSYVDAW